MNDTEKRVVQLEFDNKHFEKNVKQSMSTIDKLDEKLSLEGVTDGVKKVNKSFKKMDMVVFTVLQRLTNKVIDLGVQLVKSLSTDNIFSGWIKYGEKTVSVATMFSQEIKIAGKAIEDDAKKLEVINEQLDKLNWFTDETSYNFTDMVDSISKFTAAGIDLDQSVEAMMGIANWAALSGQNATTASRAMYQLAQSLGKGSVQLIDYKSIQNANMDTQEFRQTVLDTAVELKMLTREGEKYITKTGKSFTKNQFTEELSEKWFSSEVLTKSLAKYSAAVDRIYEIAQETGLTASEVISRYGDELDKFGIKAFKAAQEARTFRDSLNSVKDAVSTGWMTTAEKIFGSYEESKTLWTDLANELYDVFAASGSFRNEVLSIWKELEGRSNLFKHGGSDQGAFWNMYDAIIAFKRAIKDAWRSLFPLSEFQAENDQAKDLAKKLNNITKKFKDWSAKLKETLTTSSKFYNVMRAAFSIIKVGVLSLQGALYIINPIWTALKQMFNYLTTRVALVGKNLNKLESVFTSIQKAVEKVHDVIENVVEAIDPVGFLDKVFVGISNITKVIKDYHPIEKLSKFFGDFIDSLRKNGANAENLKRIWTGLTSILSLGLKLIKTVGSFLIKFITPILEVILSLAANILSVIVGLLTHITAAIGDFFTFLNGLFEGKTENVGEKINNFCNKFAANLSKLKPILSSITNIAKGLVSVVLAIPKALDNISVRLTGNGIIENIKKIGDGIGNAIKKVADAISGLFNKGSNQPSVKALNSSGNKNIVEAATSRMFGTSSLKEANKEVSKASEFVDALKELLDGIVSVLNGIISIISSMVAALGRLLKAVGDVLQQIGKAFTDFFKTMDFSSLGRILGILASVGIILVVVKLVYNLFYGIKSLLAPVQYVSEAAGDLMDGLRYFLTFRGISYLIDSIARMLLVFSISLLVLIHVLDDKNWVAAISVLGIFTGVIMALTITLMILAKALNGTSTVTKKLGKSSKIWDRETTKTSTSTGQALYSLSSIIRVLTTGMIKIAIALRLLKDVSTEQLWRATGVLSIFLVIISALIVVVTALSRSSKTAVIDSRSISKTTGSIIKFAISLRLLAGAIESLGKMNEDKMWQGIRGMSAILAAFTVFVVLSQTKLPKLQRIYPDYAGLSKMLLKFSVSLFAIVLALKVLDSIPSDKFKQYTLSFLAIIAIFGVLTTVLVKVNKSTKNITRASTRLKSSAASVAETALKIVAIGAAFALMATSLLIVVGAIAVLQTINWIKALPGLGVILTFLAGFSVFIIMLNKQTKVLNKGQKVASANLLALSVNIATMTMSLIVLAAAIALMSTFNWYSGNTWFAFGVIAAFLAAMIVMIKMVSRYTTVAYKESRYAHKSLLALSVLFATFSASLILIGASVALLSTISWENIGKGMVVLVPMLIGMIVALGLINRNSKSALLTGKSATKNILSLSALLGAFAGALIVIQASFLIMNSVSWDSLLKGLAALGIVVLSLTATAGLLTLINVVSRKIFATAQQTQLTLIGVQNVFRSMGLSLLLIATSMLIMNYVTNDSIWKAAAGISIILAALLAMTGILVLINKAASKLFIVGVKNTNLFKGLSLVFVSLGISLGLLAGSLILMDRVSNDSLWKALAGMGIMALGLLSMAGILIIMHKAGIALLSEANAVRNIVFSLGLSFASIGVSLAILAGALYIVGGVPTESFKKAAIGLTIMIVSLAAMSAILILLSRFNIKPIAFVKAAASLGMIAGALLLFNVSLRQMNKNVVEMKGALNSVNSSLMGGSNGGIGGSLLLLAAGLGIMVLSMAAITLVVGRLTKLSAGGIKSSIINVVSTILLFGTLIAAFALMIKLLSTMGSYNWEEIGKMAVGLALFAGMIFSMVGALALLQAAGINSKALINFAISLGVMVVSLLGFIGALYLLNDVSWSTIGKAAVILAGGFAVLAIAGLALKPVIPAVMQFALALFLLSAAFMLMASALGLLSDLLGPAMEEFNNNFDMIAETIGNVASLLVVALLDAFETLLTRVTDILPKIADFLIVFIEQLLRIINELAPQICQTLVTILTTILELLVSYADIIWESIMKLLLSLLKMLKNYIPEIVSELCEILILIIQTLTKYIPQIVLALFDLLTKLIDTVFGPQGQEFFLHVISTVITFLGNILSYLVNYVIQFAGLVAKLILILISAALELALASLGTIASYLIAFFGGLIWLAVEVFRGLRDVVLSGLLNIFQVIVETLGIVLRKVGPMLVVAGRYLLAQFAYGFLDAIEHSFIGSLLKFFGVSFDGAKSYLDSVSNEMNNEMKSIAGDMGSAIQGASKNILGTVSTITSTMQEITSDGLAIISSTVDNSAANIGNAMADFGKNMTMNLTEGIAVGAEQSAQTAANAGSALGKDTIEGFKEECQINSPSRVMMKMGEYLADGLSAGIENNADEPVDSMIDVVGKTKEALDEMVKEGVGDNTLTIRPVLDLDNVTEGVNDISSMMTSINGSTISTELAGKTSDEIRRSRAEARALQSKNQNAKGNVTNEGDNYYSTFNVTTNDPESFVDEVDKLLQKKRLQVKFAKGG